MKQSRMGFTVTELMVTLTILGLLVAVTVPAVQRARESSRRLRCQNNLKQLGIAMSIHLDSHQSYPRGYRSLQLLLPGLGQGALYNELVNFRPTHPDQVEARRFYVPEFICPTDPFNVDNRGHSNYLPNEGTILNDLAPTNGYDRVSLTTRPADVVDGLSNSAGLAERLVGDRTGILTPSDMEQQPKRFFWFTKKRYRGKGEELLAVKECRENRTTTFPQFYSNIMIGYGTGGSYYNHLLLPNERACYNGPEDFEMTDLLYLVPPSSLHDGGVNLLLLDGSVRFVSENIDESVWRALGTINGNEHVANSF